MMILLQYPDIHISSFNLSSFLHLFAVKSPIALINCVFMFSFGHVALEVRIKDSWATLSGSSHCSSSTVLPELEMSNKKEFRLDKFSRRETEKRSKG